MVTMEYEEIERKLILHKEVSAIPISYQCVFLNAISDIMQEMENKNVDEF